MGGSTDITWGSNNMAGESTVHVIHKESALYESCAISKQLPSRSQEPLGRGRFMVSDHQRSTRSTVSQHVPTHVVYIPH